jgi:hypothetical protein
MQMHARLEYLEFVSKLPRVICATICEINLPLNYTRQQYDNFLGCLNFPYDNTDTFPYENPSDEFHGTIWFEGGSWANRVEHEGRTFWVHYKTPEIPKELI